MDTNKISGSRWWKEFRDCEEGYSDFLHTIATEANAAIEAADKAGYERGVRESAEVYTNESDRRFIASVRMYVPEIEQSILSLLQPSPPNWCEHIEWYDEGKYWCIKSQTNSKLEFKWTFGECAICGKPRPESEGAL